MPNNATIAVALDRIASLLELENAEPTTISSYRHAARAIARCDREAEELIDEDGVDGLHELGIGWLIAGVITDWVRSGALPLLDRLEKRHDPEATFRRVPGIGPKLAREVHDIGIRDVGELADAARTGRLARICGFGPRRIALIRDTLHVHRRHSPQQLDLLNCSD